MFNGFVSVPPPMECECGLPLGIVIFVELLFVVGFAFEVAEFPPHPVLPAAAPMEIPVVFVELAGEYVVT